MKKRKLLEYFEGNPDTVYDTKRHITWSWDDGEIATCFGFFPVSIDNGYEFLSGDYNHMSLAEKAAEKLFGKALDKVTRKYDSYFGFVRGQCYDKAYAMGRIWKINRPNYPSIMAFWYTPSSKIVKEAVDKLGIDPSKYILVTEEEQSNNMENMTVLEYIESNYKGDYNLDYYINKPFQIDKKVIGLIRSYNQPAETWQSRKEKEGWGTLAQRNAALYQENRQRIDEYFMGDPDTIEEFDDETGEHIRTIRYTSKNVISFGFFQTTLNGGKEFVYKTDFCHHDISRELAIKIIGKAMASEDITEYEIRDIQSSIYNSAAYCGRIFLDANIITTWDRISSNTLEKILNLMGGLERWKDFDYIIPTYYGDGWEADGMSGNQVKVIDYIKQGISADEKRNEKRMAMDFRELAYKWLVELIEKYNEPSSALAAKTAKLGNMTIAQYNSLIHQEGKEPKQIIKENNKDMKNNNYQEEYSNYLNIMSEALKKDDYKAYEYVKQMLDEAVEDRKHEKKLMNEMNTTNFGVLNHIFESELPTLIKTNKKAVKNVINTIKEDKNLKSQFSFYNVLKEKYNGKVADTAKSKEVLEALAKIVCENIDPKTVKASNRKLRKVMIESGVKPSDFIDDDSMKLYENGNVILTTKRNSDNTIELIESYNEVCKWMDAHKEDKKTGKDADELIREFEEKLKENLTESEISFVQQITDWRSPIAEQRKEKLFNKFKNECIDKINDMLKEDADNVELKGLSDQLNEMKFDKNNIVKDIAKLLEIRDILMDD